MQGSSFPLSRNHISPSGAPSHRRALRIVLTPPLLRCPCTHTHTGYYSKDYQTNLVQTHGWNANLSNPIYTSPMQINNMPQTLPCKQLIILLFLRQACSSLDNSLWIDDLRTQSMRCCTCGYYSCQGSCVRATKGGVQLDLILCVSSEAGQHRGANTCGQGAPRRLRGQSRLSHLDYKIIKCLLSRPPGERHCVWGNVWNN